MARSRVGRPPVWHRLSQPFRGILGGGGQAAQSGPKPICQGVLNGGTDRAASGAVLPGGVRRGQQGVRGHNAWRSCQMSRASALWRQKLRLWQVQLLCSKGAIRRTVAGDHGRSTVTVLPSRMDARAEALPLDQGGYPAFSQLPGERLSGIGGEQGGQLLRRLFRRARPPLGRRFPRAGSRLGGLLLQP